MTMIDAMGRVDQIQATLDKLSVPSTLQAQGTPATAASATAFAQQLSAALGTAPTEMPRLGAGSTAGESVVAAAEKYLGVPYVFGGEDSSGMDCSGLVQRVYADIGIEVPRLVSGQMTIGTEVGSLAEAQPGDLIVTGGGEHILIYAGNNKVIHAPYEGRTVCLVDAYMTDADIDTIRRVVPNSTGSGVSSSAMSSSAISGLAGNTFTGTQFGQGAMPDLIAAALAAYARGASS